MRSLSGKGLPGSRGYVDLLLFKMAFKRVMLTEVLEKTKADVSDKDMLRKALHDHTSYRHWFDGDRQWMATLASHGLREFANFVEVPARKLKGGTRGKISMNNKRTNFIRNSNRLKGGLLEIGGICV